MWIKNLFSEQQKDPRFPPDPLDGIESEVNVSRFPDARPTAKEAIEWLKGLGSILLNWLEEDRTPTPGEVHPDRYFLILFLRSSGVYRTWIKKDDFINFREKFQQARTLEATPENIRKRFFQFGRHDEFDLLDVSWYHSRAYLIRDESKVDE